MALSTDLLASLVAFVAVAIVYLRRYRNNGNSGLPLPPGPKRLPIIGNILDMPKSFEWETYAKWGKDFNSDIVSVNLAGQNIIVVNSADVAYDLFEKRSAIYSSRTRLPMVNELMGWSFNFGFMPYGEYWRKHRKLFHQEFHPAAIVRYHPHEIKATHDLLRRLLDDGEDFLEHFRHMAGAIIMAVAYGLDVQAKDDPYIAAAKGAVHPATVAMVPGTFLVDSLPFLKYVPDWFPGAGFKKDAKEWRRLAETMWELPYTAGKRKIAAGNAPDSFISYCLEKVDESGDVEYQERIIQDTAAAMYIAGSDTPVSALGTFLLAMLDNPDAQKKAQEELDRVVGPGQFPDFSDEENLPYVSALVKEVMRWRPVTPIAVPHCLTTEDEYNGYRIPKDSVVIANAWAMLHDENTYPEPFAFKPERFLKDGKLNPDVKDPATATFGFGRRICPGRFMASSSVWIAIAMILATMDITKPLDADGNVIEPTHEYVSSMVCIPAPFKCSLKPRSKAAEKLIRSTGKHEL